MAILDFPELEHVGFVFTDRGTPIPADRRPLWRIGIVAFLLAECSRGQKSSLVRLHVLDWATRSVESRTDLLAFIDDHHHNVVIRYDPSLLRAIRFGVAEGMFEIDGKNVKLVSLGVQFAKEIANDPAIFSQEREFLTRLGKQLTERLVDQLVPRQEVL